MTDNRTNEPTEEQIERAADAIFDLRMDYAGEDGLPSDRSMARAGLVAAQGAAPQVLNVEKLLTVIGVALDATKADARGEIESGIRREVKHWLEHGDDVVLPSSGIDEAALAEVIENLDWGYMVDGPSVSEIARAVVEWLKGQGNAARE